MIDKFEKYFGAHTISFDVDTKENINAMELSIKEGDCKITGANNLNRFCKISNLEFKNNLDNYFNLLLKTNLHWSWEYCHSGEPVGLHTDWDKKIIDNFYYEIVVGIIIPLEWNCVQPYTVNYNKIAHEPRKLIYRQGEMRYLDTNDIIEYRYGNQIHDWIWDPEVLKYNPILSGYVREFAFLQVHSAYKWKIGTCLIFNPARWHASNWFLSKRFLPESYEESKEYKKSIIGFGSVKYDVKPG